jgi:putative transposase
VRQNISEIDTSRKGRVFRGRQGGEVKARLLAKYSKRERRRVDAILHKASKIIAEIVVGEKVKPVMEKLKNMRERMKYGRRMNRRLHNMPFRKIQFSISYKSIERGYKPVYVDARNTSRMCPICGELNKPNGHTYKCKGCGFQADKHLVAAWNIATKLQMCRPSPLAAKAINEALKAEVERIVIKC